MSAWYKHIKVTFKTMLLASLGTIENESFDDEFGQIVNSRVNTSRELAG